MWFSPDIIAAMLVQGTKEKKVFWEFDSIIIMQAISHNVLLFCAPTWPSHHMIETIYTCVFLFFSTGNAYQLSQLIRTLLDPENMALGANVRFSFLAKSRNFYYYSSSALSLLIYIRIPYLLVYKSTFYDQKISPKNRPRLIHESYAKT